MADKCCEKGSKTRSKIESLKRDFEALGDENRLRILCLVKAHRELCVCDIFEALDLSQNLVSYHLGILKAAGFLASRKAGVSVYYRLDASRMRSFQALIKLIS